MRGSLASQKGKVDASSLLDENGDPADSSLYTDPKKRKKRNQKKTMTTEEYDPSLPDHNLPHQNLMPSQMYPPQSFPNHEPNLAVPLPPPQSHVPVKKTFWNKLRRTST